ncbi:MAG TPA: hypothetical protein VIV11_00900 [Kofleriaceae bacterium]
MPLELEEEWSKQKAAKQEAGRQPPPRKSRKGLLVALVGIAVAGAMVAIVIYAGDESKPATSSGDRVFVEIRSMPRGDIRIDGKKVGTTPMQLQFPKSSKQIEVEVTFTETYFHARSRKRIERTYKPKQTATLDHDQTLDFTRQGTKPEPGEPEEPEVPIEPPPAK